MTKTHPSLSVKAKVGIKKRKATHPAPVKKPFKAPFTTTTTTSDKANPTPIPPTRVPSPSMDQQEGKIVMNLDSQSSVIIPSTSNNHDHEEVTEETEHEEEEDDPQSEPPQEEDSSDAPPPTSGPTRPRKVSSIILAEDVERELGEWLEHEVPFVYTKAHKDHVDRGKVARVFQEKAETLCPPLTGPKLFTWYRSLRTRYTRIPLEQTKSGQAAKRLTSREHWIRTTFSFLEPHIVRQRKTRDLGLEPPAPAPPASVVPSTQGPEAGPSQAPVPPPPRSTTPALNLTQSTSSKKVDSRTNLLEQIVGQTAQLQGLLSDTGAGGLSEREVYWRHAVGSLVKELVHVPDSLRSDLQSEMIAMVRRWRTLGERGVTTTPLRYLAHLRARFDDEEPQVPAPAPPAQQAPAPPTATAQVLQQQQLPLMNPGMQVPVLYTGTGVTQATQPLNRAPSSSTPLHESAANISNLSLPNSSFVLENFPSFNVGSPHPPPHPQGKTPIEGLNTPHKLVQQ